MSDYMEGSGVQYHLHIKTGDVGRYVLLPGDPKRVPLIAAHLSDARLVADSREYVTYTGTLDGEQVSVTSTGIGGPSAAIAMHELVACGADTFLRVGTCGGIAETVIGGDIVIATAAVRAEGTSVEYAPIAYPAAADYTMVTTNVAAAEKLEKSYHVGVVQCKDSFYGQHEPHLMPVSYELENKWEAYRRLGVLASEMESAALFVVAAHLGVRCGSLFSVVGNQERARAGLSNPISHSAEKAIVVAIESIRKLIALDRKR